MAGRLVVVPTPIGNLDMELHTDSDQHVLMLAEARGVEVVEAPELPYSCIGLIRPAS